jgi:capsular exopolysaccharide synthesis family protein
LTRYSNGFGGGEPTQHQTEGTDLSALGPALRRQLGVILLAVAVGAITALALSLTQEEQYAATASLLQRAPTPDLGTTLAPSDTPEAAPERDAATDLALASLRVVRERTVRRLERRGVSDGAGVVNDIEVVPKEDSDVIEVQATAPSPVLAARAANAFSAEYVAFRADLNVRKIREGRGLLERGLRKLRVERNRLQGIALAGEASSRERRRLRIVTSRIASLEARMEDLRITESLQSGDTTIVDRASPPTEPASPKPVKDTMVGAFAGLLLGLILALLREQLDRRVRQSKEFEQVFGLPVLASIPASKALSGGGTKPEDLPPAEREAFRMLRASLRYHKSDREIKSVMITSPAAEDGKTTVSLNLAAAAADVGMRVLLIEADVRRPGLARLFGLPSDVGLTSVLDGHTQIDELRNEVAVTQRDNGSGHPRTMDVVVAGSNTALADEVVESERMRDLIVQAEKRYDLVVVDTPPASIIADPISLLHQVSAVIVVGRLDRITGDDMVRLRTQLDRFDAPVLGVVANFTRAEDGPFAHYGYGTKTGQPAPS